MTSSIPEGTNRWSVTGSVLSVVSLFVAITVVVVAILLSQFGTVQGGTPPLRSIDEAVGGTSGGLDAPWRPIRGRWTTSNQGASVDRPGERLSLAVRPVGGVNGTIEVTGRLTDGWSVVWRWQDPGSYGLAVVNPSNRTLSLVAVVSDRTRLLAQVPVRIDLRPDADHTVAVELVGPMVKVMIDGEVVAGAREDRLTGGTAAGVAVIGPDHQALFTRFRTRPPAPPQVHQVGTEGSP